MYLKNKKVNSIEIIDPDKTLLSQKSYEFTVIMAAFNSQRYISDAIDSLINQNISFMENIQLIIIDDGSTDNTLNIALDYQSRYPENILIISQNNNGVSSARNQGLNYVKGKYVNFLDSDDLLSPNAFKEVKDFFETSEIIEVISLPIFHFEREKKADPLNYAFRKRRIINLRRHPNYLQKSVSSAFIKYESIKSLKFNEKLEINEDTLFVNKILLRKKRLGVSILPDIIIEKDMIILHLQIHIWMIIIITLTI